MLLRLLLLAVSASAACSPATLDAVLSQIELRVDTSSVPDTDLLLFAVTVGDEAVCDGFRIGVLDVVAEKTGPNTVAVGLEASQIELECRVPTTFDPLFGTTTSGDAKLISSTTAFGIRSTVTLDSDGLPASAVDGLPSCGDKVEFDLTIDLSSSGVPGSISSLFLGFLTAEVNTLVAELEASLCETLENLTISLNEFIIENDVALALRTAALIDGGGDLLAAQDALLPLPEGVELLDFSFLSGIDFDDLTGLLESVLNVSLPTSNGTDVFGTLADLFAENSTATNLLEDLLASNNLTGLVNLTSFEIDAVVLLELLENLLGANVTSFLTPEILDGLLNSGNATDLFQFSLPLPGIGDVALNVTELSFGVNTTGTDENEYAPGGVLGPQTLGLPAAPIGSLSAAVGLSFSLNVSGIEVALLPGSPNITLDFVLEDNLRLELAWDDVVVQTALLVAVDLAKGGTFELGTVIDAVAACAQASLHAPLRLAGLLLESSGVRLRATDAQDAITCALADLLNAFALLYEGGVPAAVSGAAAAAAAGAPLVPLGDDCPPYPRTPANEAAPFDFSPLAVEAGAAVTTLEGFLPSNFTVSGVTVRRAGANWFAETVPLEVAGSQMQELSTRLVSGLLDVEARLDLDGDVLLVELEGAQLMLSAEILATLSEYDVLSTPLAEVLNPNCYAAKFAPYGGLTSATARLTSAASSVQCVSCATELVADVVSGLDDASDILLVLDAVLNATTDAAVARFSPEDGVWEQTIAEADDVCRNGPAAAVAGLGTEQDDGPAFTLVGLFAAGLGAAGAVLCVPTILKNRRPEEQTAEEEDEPYAMLFHPGVPRVVRFGVPLMLAVNLALFVVGHVDLVIRIDIVGTLLSGAVTINEEEFSGFSVISSVERLWQDGARALAVMIGLFSIAWPYVKIAGVAIAWVIPVRGPRLTFARRGDALLLMDRLGKWSLLELYFVAVLLVVLRVRVAAPEALAPGLYEVDVAVLPQLNLYTFTTALLLALGISNVTVVVHDRLAQRRQPSEHTPEPVFAERRQGALAAAAAVAVAIMIFAAGAVDVVFLRSLGIVPVAAELGGEEVDAELSLYELFERGLTDVDAGRAYFGLVLVATVLLVPLAHLVLLAWISVVKQPSLDALWRLRRAAHCVAAWCGVEVFLLGVALTVLEIDTVSKTLLEEECEAVLPAIDLLNVLGLLSEDDTRAGCYVINAELRAGAFVFLVAVLAHYALNHVVLSKLDQAIKSPAQKQGGAPAVNKDPVAAKVVNEAML